MGVGPGRAHCRHGACLHGVCQVASRGKERNIGCVAGNMEASQNSCTAWEQALLPALAFAQMSSSYLVVCLVLVPLSSTVLL